MQMTSVQYKEEHIWVHNRPQTIYTLAVKPMTTGVEIQNAFSLGQLHGYESVSSMVREKKALAGINGMFYDRYGMPYGTFISNGELVARQFVGTPILTLEKNGKASLDSYKIFVYLDIPKNNHEIYISALNAPLPDGAWGIYTKDYGKTNRVFRPQVTYTVKDGKVQEIVSGDTAIEIGDNDYLLTYVGTEPFFKLEKGDFVEKRLVCDRDLSNVQEAIQTGSWIIQNGVSVVEDFDAFMGYTTGPNPRTMVGITGEGTLIFKVADGRQPGISGGLTGKEAAQIMQEAGCVNAAFLDGGASSTFVYNNHLKNWPSSDGKEREVAHAIVFYRTYGDIRKLQESSSLETER